ncbi:MAG: cation transporter, partial [Bdellovibrio sp.]
GHLWSLDGENHIYSGHLVLRATATIADMESVKAVAKKKLKDFGIIEATLETEISGTACVDPLHS